MCTRQRWKQNNENIRRLLGPRSALPQRRRPHCQRARCRALAVHRQPQTVPAHPLSGSTVLPLLASRGRSASVDINKIPRESEIHVREFAIGRVPLVISAAYALAAVQGGRSYERPLLAYSGDGSGSTAGLRALHWNDGFSRGTARAYSLWQRTLPSGASRRICAEIRRSRPSSQRL